MASPRESWRDDGPYASAGLRREIVVIKSTNDIDVNQIVIDVIRCVVCQKICHNAPQGPDEMTRRVMHACQ
jgi:hypothetical protein